MIRKCNLPDEIVLPCGAILKPVIGGHLGQKPFLTLERSGVDVTRSNWGNDLEGNENNHVVREAKARGLKYRRVSVLSRRLRGKLDLYGRPYQSTRWVFVEVKP